MTKNLPVKSVCSRKTRFKYKYASPCYRHRLDTPLAIAAATKTEAQNINDLPDETLTKIFGYLGGGRGKQSLRNSICLYEARQLVSTITDVCPKWNRVYQASKHLVLATLKMAHCDDESQTWMKENQGRNLHLLPLGSAIF